MMSEPLSIPPPISAVNRLLFLGVAIIAAASMWVLVAEWATVWSLHEPSLRIELWVAASIVFSIGIWTFQRGFRRRASTRPNPLKFVSGLKMPGSSRSTKYACKFSV